MSTQQITLEAMALPLAERVLLAQVLWDSIDDTSKIDDLDDALYQELKIGAEAPVSEFVTFDIEAVIRRAKERPR